MSAQPKHNLEQYRKQAKDLFGAYRSGEDQAIALVRQHLPRLNEDSQSEIVLTEAQHVIACQHGFKDWNWLRAVSTLDLERLAGCSNRDLVVLLRESDQLDIVVCLSQASAQLRSRFLNCVSDRVRGYFEEETGFLGPRTDEELDDSRRRLILNAAGLAANGQLAWPENSNPPAPDHRPSVKNFFDGLATRPLEAMTLDEIILLWRQISDLARREGIVALDEVEATPFVRESLFLMVDGTEPALIEDLLKTRLEMAILGGLDTRIRMVIEALMSIHSGDNPRIVHHKLLTFFVDHRAPVQGAQRPEQNPAPEIQAQLEQRLGEDLSGMDYGEIASLFTDMAYLRRRGSTLYTHLSTKPPIRRCGWAWNVLPPVMPATRS